MSDITSADLAVPVFSELELRQDWYPRGHPVDAYLRQLDSEGSRRAQASALEQVVLRVAAQLRSSERGDRRLRYQFPWHLIRRREAIRIRDAIASPDPETGRPYAPATANRMLVALRRVLEECWLLGYLSADDYQRARRLQPVKGARLGRGRHLAAAAVLALFQACARDPGAAGRRDAAMFAVLVGTGGGVRRAEAAQLQLEDLVLDQESELQGQLRILGKGNKERTSWLTESALPAIEAWLEVRGRDPGPLFKPVRKGGEVLERQLTPEAIRWILRRRCREAGIEPPAAPHDLRRTNIGELLELTGDLSAVQKLAGHSDPATTSRYDRRPEAARRRVARSLHVPYVPPG